MIIKSLYYINLIRFKYIYIIIYTHNWNSIYLFRESFFYKINTNKVKNRIYLHDLIFCFLFNEMNSLNQKNWLKNIPWKKFNKNNW